VATTDTTKTVPIANGITSGNIIAAYVYHDPYQQRRIEAWGKLNRQVIRDLIVSTK